MIKTKLKVSNILDILLFLYIFSLFTVERGAGWVITEALAMGLISIFVFDNIVNEKKIRVPGSWHSLLFFSLFSLASFFWGTHPYIYSLFSILHITFIAFVIINYVFSNGINGFIYNPIILGCLVSTVLVWQEYGNIFSISSWRRIGSPFFQNPNSYAFALSTGIIMLAYNLFFSERKDNLSLKYKGVHLFFLVLFTYQIFALTGSRKGFVGAIIILVGTIMYIVLDKLSHINVKKGFQLLILLVVLFYSFTNLVDSVIDTRAYIRFENMVLSARGEVEGDGSLQLRSTMIDEGFRLISEKPFLGWGVGQYRFVSGLGSYSHNNYIEIFANAGVVGFLFYYGFYITSIGKAAVYVLKRKRIGNISFFFIVTAFLLFNDFGMVTYYNRLFWVIAAVAVGILEKTNYTILIEKHKGSNRRNIKGKMRGV